MPYCSLEPEGANDFENDPSGGSLSRMEVGHDSCEAYACPKSDMEFRSGSIKTRVLLKGNYMN